MPHREAAWALLAERLDEAAWLCSELCAGRGAAIAARLDPVLAAITEIAGTLAARRLARIPQSAIGGQPCRPDHVRSELYRISTVLNRSSGACEVRHASRLREVAAALDATAAAGADQAGAAIWSAAQTATRLRAALGLAGQCPPELAEATAALQRLALALTPRGERDTRLAGLWDLQSGLAACIQTARNGPYLVTNVPVLTDPLEAGARPAPQLALCRCGGSAAKPACDGACARNGFTDAKDPKRVPDRRDTYEGQQVTIFDNRGICQHSGYCTGRLPTVFRAGTEPFVAPSGGRMDEIIRAVRDCPSGALSYGLGGTEDRAHVDWDGTRTPAIEITRDGPYRVTGGIPLTGPDGFPVPRAEGSSAEHYALCRCGHSRNKPFCSGMHWYVQFRDPALPGEPSLFEWAGGLGALTRMARLLCEKHVPADPLLAGMPTGRPNPLPGSGAWSARAPRCAATSGRSSPASSRPWRPCWPKKPAHRPTLSSVHRGSRLRERLPGRPRRPRRRRRTHGAAGHPRS